MIKQVRNDKLRTDAFWVSVESCGTAVTSSTSEAVFTDTLTRVVTVVYLSPHLVTPTCYNIDKELQSECRPN